MSTIILEVINFLVLVWILKRFLYQPVLNIIDKRKRDIEEKLEQAQLSTQTAESLQEKYEQRLKSWQQEMQTLREQLDSELSEHREQRLSALDKELDELRNNAKERDKRQQAEQRRSLEYQAITQSNQFVAKLMQRLACPALQEKLIQLLVDELQQLSEDKLSEFARRSADQSPSAIKVESAYPLNDTDKKNIQTALSRFTQQDLPFEYRQQSGLLAGLQIDIGGWVLEANLKNELHAFTELKHANV